MSNNNSKSNPIRRWILIALAVILAGTLIWGISWATYARPPLPEALTALESDDLVEVSQDPWLIFTPIGDIKAGLIFYPGGRIDPRGYAPLMRAIAGEGYLVVVPSMPINMAIFDVNAADEIIAHYNDIEVWVISGHSVGGTSAAIYAANNPGKIAGLAIWASYPPNSTDLSGANLPVYSIYGELDSGVDRPAIEERKSIMPSGTVYLEIPGGDHHQFGSYLIEPDQDHSTTPRAVQQEQIIKATLDLLKTVAQ